MWKLCGGREAYIREQMRKRLGQDADEVAASSSQMHPQDELYAVPSDLQVRTARHVQTALNPPAVCPVAASQLSQRWHVADAIPSVWPAGQYNVNAIHHLLDSPAETGCMHGAMSSCCILLCLI